MTRGRIWSDDLPTFVVPFIFNFFSSRIKASPLLPKSYTPPTRRGGFFPSHWGLSPSGEWHIAIPNPILWRVSDTMNVNTYQYHKILIPVNISVTTQNLCGHCLNLPFYFLLKIVGTPYSFDGGNFKEDENPVTLKKTPFKKV